MNVIRKYINTRLNGIKYKERCTTPYKHMMIITRNELGQFEKRCCWCNKEIKDICAENKKDDLELMSHYQTQMEWI